MVICILRLSNVLIVVASLLSLMLIACGQLVLDPGMPFASTFVLIPCGLLILLVLIKKPK